MMREAREELGATAGADGQRGGQRWNVDGGPVGVEVTASKHQAKHHCHAMPP